MADEDPMSSSESESDRDDEGELVELESAVAANPESYEAHEKYVAALRKSGQLEKLRAAREAMNALFPMPGKMWQEWAKDEANLLSGAGDDASDLSPMLELYERGLKEYLYVPLWLDYLEFVEERDPAVSQCSPQGLRKMRELYERAITAAGIHAAEGSRIWEAYREFEQAVLLAMADYSKDDEDKKNQAGRVESLFQRQLGLPLKDHPSTLEEYTEWQKEQGKEPNVPPAYERAAAAWLECKMFEDSVAAGKPADAELLQNYMLYIDYEQNKNKSDPARIQMLYERAVSIFPVAQELWLKYTRYLDQKLKVESASKNVYSRAVRNCPWVGELWVKYLLMLERFNCKEEELSGVFEQSMQKGFQGPDEYLDVFLTRVDGLRRQMAPVERMREVFQRASEFLSNFFPDFVDRRLRLHGYWASVEVRLGKDISAARHIWESLVKSKGWMAEVWQGYINMELGLENLNEVRALYKKCYSRKLEGNGSEAMCQAWLQFEREYGTLEEFDRAVSKAGERLAELQVMQAPKDVQGPKVKQERVNQENSGQASKRKRGKDVKVEKKRQKRPEHGKPHDEGPREETMVPTRQDDNKDVEAKGEARRNRVFTDELTVFVSNIDLELSEKDLRECFASCGGLKGVRLLRDRNTKRSRGLAYIDFESEENLEAALAKNKTKLGSRKMSVARSKPTKGKAKQEDGDVKRAETKVKPLGWQAPVTNTEEVLTSNEEFRKKLLNKGN